MSILSLWGILAYAPTHGAIHGWQYAGEFRSADTCLKAARALDVKDGLFRCVPK